MGYNINPCRKLGQQKDLSPRRQCSLTNEAMRLMEYALFKKEFTLISIDAISIFTGLCFQKIRSVTEQ